MISFVYFDLGGVAILDFSGTNKWGELKKEWGITPEKEAEFNSFWQRYEKEICISRDVETLLPQLKKKFWTILPPNYSILTDGFVNRFEANKSIWPVIEKIKKRVRIGLLTNSYLGMLRAIKSKAILPDIKWDVIVDSSVEGWQKPDPLIFELAEKRAGVEKSEILFVENSPAHIKAAQKAGWQTFLYDPRDPESSSLRLSIFVTKLGPVLI